MVAIIYKKPLVRSRSFVAVFRLSQIIIILSKLCLELIRKAHFIIKKGLFKLEIYKFITSHSEMLGTFANCHEW